MEDSKVLRSLMESIEPMMDSEPSDVPQEQIGSEPMLSLKSIMESIKTIVSALQSDEHIDDITSGLHNVSEELKQLAESVGSLEECHGTEDMGPNLVDKDGAELQVYSVPGADSFPERNGFVG